MRPIHTAIDARLPDAGQGGVLSVLKAMAEAFRVTENSSCRRTWIVLKQANWWRHVVPKVDDIIELSMPAGSVAARIPTISSRLAPSVLKVLGDRNYLDSRLTALGVDVVHLPYQDGVYTDLPFVYFPHDLQHRYLPENFTDAQIRHRETRWKRRALAATRVVAAGEHVKRDLISLWGVPPHRVLVYPFPPPTKLLPADTSKFSHRDPYIVFPAVFWPHKNHLLLIQAMSILRDRGSTLQLLLTGAKNTTFHPVMRLIETLNLSHQVQYLGHVDETELSGLLHAARAVVLPSLFEAVSLTAFDAIRAGRPLVCSDREFFKLQCGDRASYFDPLSPVSIADAIARATERDQADTSGADNLDSLTEQLSLDAFARNLYATYHECAGGS